MSAPVSDKQKLKREKRKKANRRYIDKLNSQRANMTYLERSVRNLTGKLKTCLEEIETLEAKLKKGDTLCEQAQT